MYCVVTATQPEPRHEGELIDENPEDPGSTPDQRTTYFQIKSSFTRFILIPHLEATRKFTASLNACPFSVLGGQKNDGKHQNPRPIPSFSISLSQPGMGPPVFHLPGFTASFCTLLSILFLFGELDSLGSITLLLLH